MPISDWIADAAGMAAIVAACWGGWCWVRAALHLSRAADALPTLVDGRLDQVLVELRGLRSDQLAGRAAADQLAELRRSPLGPLDAGPPA